MCASTHNARWTLIASSRAMCARRPASTPDGQRFVPPARAKMRPWASAVMPTTSIAAQKAGAASFCPTSKRVFAQGLVRSKATALATWVTQAHQANALPWDPMSRCVCSPVTPTPHNAPKASPVWASNKPTFAASRDCLRRIGAAWIRPPWKVVGFLVGWRGTIASYEGA